MTPAPDLRHLDVGVLLNTSSGSCDAQAEQAVEDCLTEAGITPKRVWCGIGADVDRSLDEATSEAVDVLVVIGGDGTIRAAAERCGPDGPLLAPLPGGTMNMLPKTLYGSRSWREALRDTLAAPAIQPVNGAVVDGHRFYVAGIFGESSRFADAREAVREGDLVGAIEKGVEALRQALAYEIRYRFGEGLAGSAEAIAVMCPLTSELGGEAPLLEAAAIDPEGPADALRLVLAAAFRDWRADPDVARAKVARMELSSDGPIPALLDGERFSLSPSARVELVQGAFLALRPAEPDEA